MGATCCTLKTYELSSAQLLGGVWVPGRRPVHTQVIGSAVERIAFCPLWSSDKYLPVRKRLVASSRDSVRIYRVIEEENSLQHLALEHQHILEAAETLTALAFYDSLTSRFVIGAVSAERPVIHNIAPSTSDADDFVVDFHTSTVVCLWDIENQFELVRELKSEGLGEVTCITASPFRIYASDVQGVTYVWEKAVQEPWVLATAVSSDKLHRGRAIAMEADAYFLYSAGADLTIGVWRSTGLEAAIPPIDASTAHQDFKITSLGGIVRPSSRWGLSQAPGRGCESPQGFLFAAAVSDHDEGLLTKWDLAHRRCASCIRAHVGCITSVAFGPYDNGPVITGGQDGFIKMWEVSTMSFLGSVSEHVSEVRGMCAEPQHLFFSCSADGTLKVWDLASNHHVDTFRVVTMLPESFSDNISGPGAHDQFTSSVQDTFSPR